MPTPYGSRGGMAFGANELRVLRRALALALEPRPASAQDVQDCLRLAGSLDEATREGARLRDFLLADLARYRAALPGALTGYLALLEELLPGGYRPVPEDLAALRALRGNPRAARLLARCPAPAARIPAPAGRVRLRALPGGRGAEATPAEPEREPAPRAPAPGRPVPTPAEVFPPRRRPAAPPEREDPPPPAKEPQERVAG
ncbi:hypothetical protein [Streptomyces physcomitrii]|uniref:Uncharacterized protein n=1 Tax=Streptomyces physcomitrii TaxID=2724184 RepID=A0ABX1H8D0_9ACTN|nr:hypothetical protein [Streptomyces physcomitrii]NKI44621.1 hypothetical protein [Streptomyces physcomitrii]